MIFGASFGTRVISGLEGCLLFINKIEEMHVNLLTKNKECGIIQKKNSRVFNIDTGFSVRFGRFAAVWG